MSPVRFYNICNQRTFSLSSSNTFYVWCIDGCGIVSVYIFRSTISGRKSFRTNLRLCIFRGIISRRTCVCAVLFLDESVFVYFPQFYFRTNLYLCIFQVKAPGGVRQPVNQVHQRRGHERDNNEDLAATHTSSRYTNLLCNLLKKVY